MNILVVDDQTSVLHGIEYGVHFQDLGFDQVFYATSALMARDILSKNKVHVMLCDIEMPGENGLELNRFVSQEYPDIIRILLTSHAEFSYAQESIKLGCFDYILQPAPYDEIEQALSRAVDKYHLDQEHRAVYEKGRLFEELKPEMSDRIVLNLFTRNVETSKESRYMLERMGYPLYKDSLVKIFMLDIYSYVSMDDPNYGDVAIRKNFISAVEHVRYDHSSIYTLLTLNRYKRYVFLFFSNDGGLSKIDNDWCEKLYGNLKALMSSNLALYISDCAPFVDNHDLINAIEDTIANNVSLSPGIHYTGKTESRHEITSSDLKENINRWKRMIDNADFELLNNSVNSYLDFISSARLASFNSLCDLHQQLTQLFFNYMYDNSIEISDVFTEEYSYQDMQDAYQNIDTLKKAVLFVTKALDKKSSHVSEDDDILKAKNFILNNINRDLTVKEVADHVHRSPEYFTKVFKKETGHNIKTYITQVKLDVAKDMLSNPNIPISLISCEIGYTNFSHFTQMFKKYENMTPTEYRKAKLG
ncbi:MAG: helix-turn-helix domain-containing protein [Butyrivibrio sp.]|nr:helix-turn-helix domain-containing protein [Butyrivibrio sp.]